jgi:hypothetical protein
VDVLGVIENILTELLNHVQSGGTLTSEQQDLLGTLLSETAALVSEGKSQNQLQREQAPASTIQPIQPDTQDATQLLWILSGGNTNAFVNYLRTYPDEAIAGIANNPSQINQIVQKLQSQNPIAPPGVSDGIPDTQIRSSNVVGMRYDPKTQKLLVKFWGGGNKRDPIYSYDGVPPVIFSILEHGNAFAKTTGKNARGQWWRMKNPSIGAAVNQYLKAGGYSYEKIS